MRHNDRRRSDNEFFGAIPTIRAVEDCIRASHKYTEGIRTIRTKHPIQGDEFPSKKLCKLYEVYPQTEVSWNMGSGDMIDLLWGDTPRIDVLFDYDYRTNKASLTIESKSGALEQLLDGIPGLWRTLSPDMTSNGRRSNLSKLLNTAAATEKQRALAAAVPDKAKPKGVIDKFLDLVTPRKRQ